MEPVTMPSTSIDEINRCFDESRETSGCEEHEEHGGSGSNGSTAEEEPPLTRPLASIHRPKDCSDELLKHRFLCRGAGMLIAGPTGIGKSALSMQMMVLWALGRACFDIKPARPLRSVLIQAENDDGDLAEMRDGVLRGLAWSEDERTRALSMLEERTCDNHTAATFIAKVVAPIAETRPDIIWIDPAFAYVGGDGRSQEIVGAFLRNDLNPVLRRTGCAAIIIHHTNKPGKADEKDNWSVSDYAYLGSGSNEWANWPRAVIALRSIGAVFELILGKRGVRVGWHEEDGTTPVFKRIIAHSKEKGVICWRDADPEEAAGITAKKKPEPKTKDDLLRLVPMVGAISKKALISHAGTNGIGEKRADGFLAELLDEKAAFEWRIPRPRTNPEIKISRHEQTLV